MWQETGDLISAKDRVYPLFIHSAQPGMHLEREGRKSSLGATFLQVFSLLKVLLVNSGFIGNRPHGMVLVND